MFSSSVSTAVLQFLLFAFFSLEESRSLTLSLQDEVVVVKVGGSSITHKNEKETLNEEQVEWFSKAVASSISHHFKAPSSMEPSTDIDCPNKTTAFVVIHGAGSFGHHHAKHYGLSGKTLAVSPTEEESSMVNPLQMEGLAKTRLSVQSLNRILLGSLIDAGVNAVSVSPCFGAPSMRADGSSEASSTELRAVVESALSAGLVPVLHGDACLHGQTTAGILSGDTLFQILGLAPWVTRGVFLTDVEGVYTADPRSNPNATFVPAVGVDGSSGDVVLKRSALSIEASDSMHPEDVTGGFRTKLAAALTVAREGTNVTIARCGSISGENALHGIPDSDSTVIYRID